MRPSLYQAELSSKLFCLTTAELRPPQSGMRFWRVQADCQEVPYTVSNTKIEFWRLVLLFYMTGPTVLILGKHNISRVSRNSKLAFLLVSLYTSWLLAWHEVGDEVTLWNHFPSILCEQLACMAAETTIRRSERHCEHQDTIVLQCFRRAPCPLLP